MGLGSLLFDWWDKATLGTRVFTWRRGELVGSDEFGNRYYQEKRRGSRKRPFWDRQRRWVIYAGEAEASRVPPAWNGWLQHTNAQPPTGERRRYEWERPHVPNLTGTPAAYRPPGDLTRAGPRDRATGDYEPWRPDGG